MISSRPFGPRGMAGCGSGVANSDGRSEPEFGGRMMSKNTSNADSQSKPEGNGAPSGRWLAGVLGALGVAAFAAAYLLYAFVAKHLDSDFVSVCSFSATFDCDKLNLSNWGKIPQRPDGIPITIFALGFYGAMAYLAAIASKGGARGQGALKMLFGGSLAAVGFGVLLLWVMVFQEGVYCPFCLAMDAGAVCVLVLSWLALRKSTGAPADVLPPLTQAVVVGLILFVVPYGWYSSKTADFVGASIEAADESFDSDQAAPAAAATGEKAYKIDDKNFYVPVGPNDASLGPEDAKVTVVEFADFQCGYCKKLFYSLTPLKKKFADEVRFVFKHFPMNKKCNDTIKNDRHRYACDASVAAECARRQGRFWEMHDLLFKNQHKLKPKDLQYYAEQVGLDMAQYGQCLRDPSAVQRIKDDVAMAADIEITGTPRTYINGRYFRGALPQQTLEHVILQELGRKAAGEKPQPIAKASGPTPAQAKAAAAQVKIDHGKPYYIDSFEASLDAKGRALSLYGQGAANASWYEAKAACEKAGKRLCTTEEWVTACQGTAAVDDDGNGNFADDYVEGNQFPYADYYERGFCRDMEDRKTGKPGKTGSKPRCATADGVYDLGGNVAEWAGEVEGKAVLLGGDFRSKDKSGCFRPNATYGPGHKNIGIGFRCCSDEAVANAGSGSVDAKAPDDMIGRPLPSFEGRLLTGEVLKSKSLKGKLTYLSFYASWCGPCRKEMPALEKLHAEYGDRGFQVVAVGVDTKAAKSRRFVEKLGVTFPVVLDPKNTVLGKFDVRSMPTSYLVDQNGVIQWKKVGFGDQTVGEIKPEIEKYL